MQLSVMTLWSWSDIIAKGNTYEQFVNNFLVPIQVRLSPNFVSHIVDQGRDEVIKFWKVKVKGQGRWGRYARY